LNSDPLGNCVQMGSNSIDYYTSCDSLCQNTPPDAAFIESAQPTGDIVKTLTGTFGAICQ